MTAILLSFKGTLMYFKDDVFYASAKADLDNAINEFDQALFLQVSLIDTTG